MFVVAPLQFTWFSEIFIKQNEVIFLRELYNLQWESKFSFRLV